MKSHSYGKDEVKGVKTSLIRTRKK